MQKNNPIDRDQYWRRTRRLTFFLLAIWFLVTCGVAMFARAMSGITLFGWSLSYYMAAQGAMLVYLVIIGVYTWRMSKLDKLLADGDAHGDQ
jgi:putative solute:sodium symporter small subunit